MASWPCSWGVASWAGSNCGAGSDVGVLGGPVGDSRPAYMTLSSGAKVWECCKGYLWIFLRVETPMYYSGNPCLTAVEEHYQQRLMQERKLKIQVLESQVLTIPHFVLHRPSHRAPRRQ